MDSLRLWRQHALGLIEKAQYSSIYTSALVVCLIMFLALGYMVLNNSLLKERAVFAEYVETQSKALEKKMLVNRFVLDGLDAFINDTTVIYNSRVQNYASRLITNYPHIHSVHIIHALPREDEVRFIQQRRDRNDPEFTIHSSQSALQTAKSFYPLVFTYPPQSEPWLGIGADIQILTNLQFPLFQSQSFDSDTSTFLSPPLLLENQVLGFAVFHPGSAHQHHESENYPIGSHRYIPFLIVDANALLPDAINSQYSQKLVYTFGKHNQHNTLFDIKAEEPGWGATLFPKLTESRRVFAGHQGAYQLIITRQLGFQHIHFLRLSLVMLLSVLFGAFLIVSRQVYQQREVDRMAADKRLHFLANYDLLTGLPNRNYLQDFAHHAMAFATRHDSKLAFLYLDLDGFKSVNDSYGHAIGDLTLVQVASAIKQRIRQDDICARVGGDEFVILLQGVQAADECDALINSLKQAVANIHHIKHHPVSLGLSVGLSLYPDSGDDLDKLLTKADQLMYQEKRNGTGSNPIH